ncbi:hypothetical protein EGH24_11250 [Halonotius terrestris]|uniref:DUF8124 domain-containing protein n=1 Tax=Halonotius terrestris TaxID=2487750 RepID=A0A8J8PAB5_9EURY|nr:hypothetical protein [Halonotius terrestris]TQQ79206.1 hypothetical protein EGH24_11250 [Halonotius terrestris]
MSDGNDAENETAGEGASDGDRFVVGIHVTDSELRFVVHVPSDIDSGWRDPDEFQQLVEEITWEQLDRETTLRAIATDGEPGETVTLGSVTLQPDGTVVDHALSMPTGDE